MGALALGPRNPGLALSTASAALLLVVIAASSMFWNARLKSELSRTKTAARTEGHAKKDALDKLWRSHLSPARAGRFSRRPGQRLDSLAALKEAVVIARQVARRQRRWTSCETRQSPVWPCPTGPGAASVAVPPALLLLSTGHTGAMHSRRKGGIRVFSSGDDRLIVSLPGAGGR